MWDLSEIFNVVVLKSPRYQNIIDRRYVLPYPDHKHLLPQFQKAYKNSCDAEGFVKRGIVIIRAKK